MIKLKPAGLWLKLFMLLNKRGWRKPFNAEALEEIMGISRRYAYTILETMEKSGLVETWYDIDKKTRVYRMRPDRIQFTDGYLEYDFKAGLFWGIDIRIPKSPAEEEQEDNPEPDDSGATQETGTPSTSRDENQE